MKNLFKKNKEAGEIPKNEYSRGTLLSDYIQKKISKKSPKIELANAVVQRNYWAATTLFLSMALLICLNGYMVQTNKAENNVKILLAKMYPNGTHATEVIDAKDTNNYFQANLESLMAQYVERRYSKHKDSISTDYGFAYQFMSPQLRNEFLTEFHAQKVARELEACKGCSDVSVDVGPIQHYQDDETIANTIPNHDYRSTVFITVTKRASDGSLLEKSKKIITLVWQRKPFDELNNDISSVRANPMGLVILRASVKEDPSNGQISKRT